MDSVPRQKSLSLVLPAYNEEANISTVLESIEAKVPEFIDDYEIIVVNDGSRDRTGPLCREHAKKNPRIRLIEHPHNQGYGASLRDGFQAATKDLIFFTDSDNQFDVSEIRHLLPLVDRFDIVAGFRVERRDSLLRLSASWGYNRLVRILFGLRIRDVDCAFKLFKREVIERIPLKSDDFFINTEFLAKAGKEGFLVKEMGVHHYPRTAGRTTVHPSDIPRTFRTLLRMWRDIHS